MKISLTLGILLYFLSFDCGFSQTKKNRDSATVTVTKDAAIENVLNLKKAIVEKKNGKAKAKGFRVQIHFGADRDKAKEIKAKFIQKYADYAAYEEYDMPNFKIRVGDFRSKIDAYRFLKQMQADFPSSFIVQDEIELKELTK